ncbi:ABC-type cobalt transport system, permease component CbiQ [Desulfosporosinus orientis DSM 765]|uniref:ABC-type cobalt transport system, permease component CbiQ n=1 Tax=Desulfosporosinus orientis (strain ATCC 19365 / DSM 765 / NCIMB 8382 / VKM B-1628 / Singapore I) TaxID=768706 RepID=G7W7L4_DESOD|nr:energy-coupling factor transporter transmembrane component T [Desulfosporosinus orientis]AET65933.1 ABC-type cobalt transport system, permease component CbiQ [Desulfosporosinus orientis DSM 765]
MWQGEQKIHIGAQAILVMSGVLSFILLHSWLALLILTLLLLVLAAFLGLFGSLLKRLTPIVYLSVVIIVLHSLVNPHNLHYIYVFGLEGFNYGLTTSLRLLGIVTLTQIFMLSNPLSKIISSLCWIHPDLGTILGLVLSILPVIREQMEVTLNVQKARGMRIGKYPWQRIQTYLAVMIPIIIKSMIRAQTMAQLLHVRGYNSKRIHKRVNWNSFDKLVVVSGLGIFLICLWIQYGD